MIELVTTVQQDFTHKFVVYYKFSLQVLRDIGLEGQVSPDVLSNHGAVEPHPGKVVDAAEAQEDFRVRPVPPHGCEEGPVVPRPAHVVAHRRVLR